MSSGKISAQASSLPDVQNFIENTAGTSGAFQVLSAAQNAKGCVIYGMALDWVAISGGTQQSGVVAKATTPSGPNDGIPICGGSTSQTGSTTNYQNVSCCVKVPAGMPVWIFFGGSLGGANNKTLRVQYGLLT